MAPIQQLAQQNTQPTTQPTSQQAASPLEQLKDIHLPDPIEQFQLAPGWLILIILTIGLIIYAILQWHKKRQALALLIPANSELDLIAQSKADGRAIAELSALLKRVCLIYFPTTQVAALSGESWTKFINQHVGHELFTEQQQQLFAQLAYQANCQVEPSLWNEVINSSRTAINSIIRQGAKTQRKNTSKIGSN
jgi:hypothetical protein